VTELGILANAGAPIQFLELASIYDNFLGILLMYLMLCEQIPLYSTLGYVYPPDLLLAPKSYVSSLFLSISSIPSASIGFCPGSLIILCP